MELSFFYLILADVLLILHVLVVAFVVVGLVVIYVGKFLFWAWVRNPWFRLLHIAAICIVTIQTWLGFICPLTSWEMSLRKQAGDAVYSGSFISHWLEAMLYYQLPYWVFIIAYTIFAALVIVSWFIVRPRPF